MSGDVQAFVLENPGDTWVLPASVEAQNERKMEEAGRQAPGSRTDRQEQTNAHIRLR